MLTKVPVTSTALGTVIDRKKVPRPEVAAAAEIRPQFFEPCNPIGTAPRAGRAVGMARWQGVGPSAAIGRNPTRALAKVILRKAPLLPQALQ